MPKSQGGCLFSLTTPASNRPRGGQRITKKEIAKNVGNKGPKKSLGIQCAVEFAVINCGVGELNEPLPWAAHARHRPMRLRVLTPLFT
jgi:hypothetical protein